MIRADRQGYRCAPHGEGAPDISKMICVDMKGMTHYDRADLMSFAELLALGDANEAGTRAVVARC